MNNLKMRVIFVGMILSAVGCTGAVDKFAQNDEYQSKDTPYDKPIVLPHDLSDGSIENVYPVPEVGEVNHAAHVSTLPPGTQIKK